MLFIHKKTGELFEVLVVGGDGHRIQHEDGRIAYGIGQFVFHNPTCKPWVMTMWQISEVFELVGAV